MLKSWVEPGDEAKENQKEANSRELSRNKYQELLALKCGKQLQLQSSWSVRSPNELALSVQVLHKAPKIVCTHNPVMYDVITLITYWVNDCYIYYSTVANSTESLWRYPPPTTISWLSGMIAAKQLHRGVVMWLMTCQELVVGLYTVSYTHLTLPTIYSV